MITEESGLDGLPPCCRITARVVQLVRRDVGCDCGEVYLFDWESALPPEREALLPAPPTADMVAPRASRPSPAPDPRVQVADEERLRPSSVGRPTRPSVNDSTEVAELRDVLRELRPDASGPFGWPADGAPPKHTDVMGALASRIRVDGGGGAGSSVPVGAFASAASITLGTERRARIEGMAFYFPEASATLLWMQTRGTLAAGHAAFYRVCGKHFSTEEERAAWGNAEQQREEALALGRARTTYAIDVWRGRVAFVRCEPCKGRGDVGPDGAARATCSACGGRGEVERRVDLDATPAPKPERTHIDAETMARSVENVSRQTAEALARASTRQSRPGGSPRRVEAPKKSTTTPVE